jgi:hypothetical protein
MNNISEYLKPVINEFIAQREQKLIELETAITSGRYTKIKSLIEELDKYSSLAETGIKIKNLFEERRK